MLFRSPLYEAPHVEIIEIEIEGIIAASSESSFSGGRFDGDLNAF